MLKTRASQRGKNIIMIGQLDPLSKMYSRCGMHKLSNHMYHCNACGLTVNREFNAVININKFTLGVAPAEGGGPVDISSYVIYFLQKTGAGMLVDAGSISEGIMP